jgi:TPP-dependent pyruvate/acetoin dehydrogenase alpha subunit
VKKPQYSEAFLHKLYRQMITIRHFEERVKYLFLEGALPGTIHQCHGQEACAVGVCAALEKDDVITTSHRPHGHCLAKGMSPHEMMAELFGKATGCCKGKGGSMHMGNLDVGVIPAIAIVGGNIPVAGGAALAFKLRGERRVAISFMGDGAVNEGIFHEALNMAALWDLPAVFVVENNLYGASTHVGLVVRTETIAERADIYKMPGARVDGNDPLAVYESAREAVRRARDGEGPTLLELMTYRITGHSRRDPCLYQPDGERKAALANEPIGRFREFLLAKGFATRDQLDGIAKAVELEIEDAVNTATGAPDPEPEDALRDVYVEAL